MTNVIVTGSQFAWNIASRLTSVARFIAGALPEKFPVTILIPDSLKGHITGITRPLI